VTILGSGVCICETMKILVIFGSKCNAIENNAIIKVNGCPYDVGTFLISTTTWCSQCPTVSRQFTSS
jgi:hypothetical protein